MDNQPPEGTASHLDHFRGAMEQLGEPGGLFRAALLVSAIQYPGLPPGWWNSWVDRARQLGEKAAEECHFGECHSGQERLERFARFFCDTLGFHGDAQSYHAPENSCLTDVLTNMQGLPITLSIVFCELGRANGMDLFGVATPAHFICGARADGRFFFISPFDGPEVMEPATAAELVARVGNLPVDQVMPHLIPAQPHDTIRRMLNNLKVSYATLNDFPRLVRTLDYILAIEPDNRVELRNRGLILLRVGERRRGASDLLEYVQGPVSQEELEIIHEEAQRALREGKDS